MSKKQKKDKAARSPRQRMGIEEIKDYCIATRMGNLVFFIIKPTNISVLPDSSISARIYALLNVVKGQAEIEMLALNSKESFERNKDFYRERLSQEELPAVRRLLEQDSKHLDRIQGPGACCLAPATCGLRAVPPGSAAPGKSPYCARRILWN